MAGNNNAMCVCYLVTDCYLSTATTKIVNWHKDALLKKFHTRLTWICVAVRSNKLRARFIGLKLQFYERIYFVCLPWTKKVCDSKWRPKKIFVGSQRKFRTRRNIWLWMLDCEICFIYIYIYMLHYCSILALLY